MLADMVTTIGIDYKIFIDKTEEHILFCSDTLRYFVKEKNEGNFDRVITYEDFMNKYLELL